MKATAATYVGVLFAAAGAPVSDAHACIEYGDYRESRPVVSHLPVAKAKPVFVPAIDRIAAAELHLDENRPSGAGAAVVAVFPNLHEATVGSSPLETRGLRILSLALVRGDGSLADVRGFAAASEADRVANLEWAVSVLRVVESLRRNDPVAQADLGEALAKRPTYESEAFAILADLADRDLVGSAYAYGALARLYAARGEGAASASATKRCEVMTK